MDNLLPNRYNEDGAVRVPRPAPRKGAVILMETTKTVITGAHIIDPSQHLDNVGNIYIENGVIQKISSGEIESGWENAKHIDASGLYAAPGFVDIHVHLRDPGLTYKEDIITGSKAAAAGGVTSVVCMPNTKPAADSPEVISYIIDKAKQADCHVYPVATITKGMKGEELSDFDALKAAGAVAVSDDGRPVANARLMQQAMMLCKEKGIVVASHCEDLDIINGGIINKGQVSQQLGVPGMDRSSEDSVTAREIALAAATDTPIHICHVSTKGSVAFIRDAKARGVKVTAETAPHYFMMTDELLLKQDADYRMNPPLREKEDCLAVLEAVRDGVIDVIATDHAPHSPEEKADFRKAPNGIVGLETSFAACMTSLVHPGIISLYGLVERMSTRPAELMHLPAGTLKPGAAADVVLFDPEESWIVKPEKMHSKARNTPFKGMTLKGRVKATVLDGRIVYDIR